MFKSFLVRFVPILLVSGFWRAFGMLLYKDQRPA